MPPLRSPDFPRDAIAASLERIAASPHLARSLRLGRFLRFTVESILEGRAEELKERTIGVEVYGRPHDYDPHADPIVRSEAHRLRTRLAAYYAREGAADPIVIDLPKGSYVPGFGPNTFLPTAGSGECRLVLMPFEDRSARGRDAAHARAMQEALGARLAAWPGLRVLHRPSWGRHTRRASAHLAADYAVEGALERRSRRCTVTVRLVRLADEKPVWSATESCASGRLRDLPETLAEKVAASIGATLTRSARPEPPRGARAYELYVKGRHSAIQFANTLDLRRLEQARRRLRAALELEPEYADALAELANLELLRLYPPRGDPAEILARARGILERALAVEPRHARSLYRLGHVEGSALRPREALRLTETAVAIDPDDAEARTMIAARYASLGFWESAIAACDWSLSLDPVWDAAHWIKLYLLTRAGKVESACRAIDELSRSGASPTEVAFALFDLRVAEGDFAGAEAALASPESTLPLRPDLEDRREIARALAAALQGRRREARRKLDSHRSDAPRFWDHTIRLSLAVGEEGLALEHLARNPNNRSYRWLTAESLVRPHLRKPGWRGLLEELGETWLRDLEEIGPRLPVAPPRLPCPEELIGSEESAPARPLSDCRS